MFSKTRELLIYEFHYNVIKYMNAVLFLSSKAMRSFYQETSVYSLYIKRRFAMFKFFDDF